MCAGQGADRYVTDKNLNVKITIYQQTMNMSCLCPPLLPDNAFVSLCKLHGVLHMRAGASLDHAKIYFSSSIIENNTQIAKHISWSVSIM